MTVLYDLLTQISIPKPEQFWPATVAGWVTVFGFLASTAWLVFQSGRWAQKLEDHKREIKTGMDGLGARVGRIELGKEHEEGRVEALERQMSRTQGQYEALIALLGEAKESVNQFRMGNQALGEKFERGIGELRRDQNDMRLELSQRLKAVETILERQ
jgi:hypothetical protein